ncbi:MAG TPA: hypothetical protein DCQ64_20245 [Candidatus Rokubacteria bacterium]|nr:hypothetical protein [Candidatus Rokubacteria bacterium]
MASDYFRLLRDAIEKADRISNPTIRVNRTLITFQGAQEVVTLLEQPTAQTTTMIYPAQWGPTTSGPDGGNFQWNIAGQWG